MKNLGLKINIIPMRKEAVAYLYGENVFSVVVSPLPSGIFVVYDINSNPVTNTFTRSVIIN